MGTADGSDLRRVAAGAAVGAVYCYQRVVEVGVGGEWAERDGDASADRCRRVGSESDGGEDGKWRLKTANGAAKATNRDESGSGEQESGTGRHTTKRMDGAWGIGPGARGAMACVDAA